MCINHEVDKRTLMRRQPPLKEDRSEFCKLYATVKIMPSSVESRYNLAQKIKLSWLSPLADLQGYQVILAARNGCVNVWNSRSKGSRLFLPPLRGAGEALRCDLC